MNLITIITLIAGSITVIISLISLYKYLKRYITKLNNRIEQIELSLQTKQQFLIPQNTKIIIEENNKIITLEKEQTIIIDKIKNDMVFGKIFYNTISVKLPFKNIGEEISYET